MKVLKKGYEKEVICPHCKATLLYINTDVHLGSDIEGDYECYVECPECKTHIQVNQIYFNRK